MLNIFLSAEVKYYREVQEREDTIMYTMLWIMNGKQPLNPCILFSLQGGRHADGLHSSSIRVNE